MRTVDDPFPHRAATPPNAYRYVAKEIRMMAVRTHNPRVNWQLVSMSGCTSYIVAPLRSHGEVVGLVHADGQSRPIRWSLSGVHRIETHSREPVLEPWPARAAHRHNPERIIYYSHCDPDRMLRGGV
ncbi:GAF domain-containing protein [Rhodococcus sp. JVH1]|uniref:GAF domain-containing protein n=1 Tax=Rhodococcus sp. JVH1 TaxID=745408 RepID=UPI0035245647